MRTSQKDHVSNTVTTDVTWPQQGPMTHNWSCDVIWHTCMDVSYAIYQAAEKAKRKKKSIQSDHYSSTNLPDIGGTLWGKWQISLNLYQQLVSPSLHNKYKVSHDLRVYAYNYVSGISPTHTDEFSVYWGCYPPPHTHTHTSFLALTQSPRHFRTSHRPRLELLQQVRGRKTLH